MKIGIAFSLKPVDRCEDGPDDRYEEFDKPETVEAIADVLRGEGYDVVALGDGRDFLERVLLDPPDFVWNMAEGHGVGRSREARVPAVLEMLGIPYTGSDPLTLAAALDKHVAKSLVRAAGVKVPEGMLYPEYDPTWFEAVLGTPLIVKPAFEGSSKGIRGHCLADSAFEALGHARDLHETYRQPILIEQFIDGEEVTAGLVDHRGRVEVIGLMRIVPMARGERFVYSLEVKRDWANRVRYEAPARLPAVVVDRVRDAATAAYDALGCRDLARIDFRVKDGVPYFIEANPLPGLTPEVSDLVILARDHGIGYDDLIRRILGAALARVGLARTEAVAT